MIEKQGGIKKYTFIPLVKTIKTTSATMVITKDPAKMSAFCSKVFFAQNAEMQDILASAWSFTVPSFGSMVV